MPIFVHRFFSRLNTSRNCARQFVLRINVTVHLTSVLSMRTVALFLLISLLTTFYSMPRFSLYFLFSFAVLRIAFGQFATRGGYLETRTDIKEREGRIGHVVLVAVCFSSSSCVCLWACLALCNRFVACVRLISLRVVFVFVEAEIWTNVFRFCQSDLLSL